MAVSKCPCLTLSRVNVMLDAKISLVPTHQLIVPSTLLAPATEIRTHKATKIHTLKPLTYELKRGINDLDSSTGTHKANT